MQKIEKQGSGVNQINHFVSVIIPVFNEEGTVRDVITRSGKALEKLQIPYEILVIDDGSFDRSMDVSRASGAKVLGGVHQGKGYAIRNGLRQARGNIMVTLDSDGSHKPEEIPLVTGPIMENRADFVSGSRFLDPEKIKAKVPRVNELGNRAFNDLIRLLTGVKISDSQSGFRAIKSAVVERMILRSIGYEIESEMLVKALKMGVRVVEVPISFEQRTVGTSRLDPLKDGIRIFNSIITSYLF